MSLMTWDDYLQLVEYNLLALKMHIYLISKNFHTHLHDLFDKAKFRRKTERIWDSTRKLGFKIKGNNSQLTTLRLRSISKWNHHFRSFASSTSFSSFLGSFFPSILASLFSFVSSFPSLSSVERSKRTSASILIPSPTLLFMIMHKRHP